MSHRSLYFIATQREIFGSLVTHLVIDLRPVLFPLFLLPSKCCFQLPRWWPWGVTQTWDLYMNCLRGFIRGGEACGLLLTVCVEIIIRLRGTAGEITKVNTFLLPAPFYFCLCVWARAWPRFDGVDHPPWQLQAGEDKPAGFTAIPRSHEADSTSLFPCFLAKVSNQKSTGLLCFLSDWRQDIWVSPELPGEC